MTHLSSLPSAWAILPESLEWLCESLRSQRENGRTESETEAVDYQLDGPVAVVPLHGPLTKNGLSFLGLKLCEGMRGVAACLRRAAEDPRAEAILLDVDSPGGTVDGVEELAQAVAEAGRAKPVYAFADGLCASAAYWIACHAHELAAPATAMVGSIGVIMMHREVSGALEKAGVTYNLITAGHYKAAGNPVEPLSQEMRAYLQSGVDDSYELFLEAVERGRGVSREKALAMADGKIFIAGEALKAGLIDRVCSWSDFLQHIKQGVAMKNEILPDTAAPAAPAAALADTGEAALTAAREDGRKTGSEEERARMVALTAAALGEEAAATLKELADSGMTPEQFAKVKAALSRTANRLDELREAHTAPDLAPQAAHPRSAAGFEELVDEYMVKNNARRGEAVRAMAAAHPAAHKKWLKELQED